MAGARNHSTLETQSESADIVVVGGGVPGLALICALGSSASFQSSQASIALVEAAPLARLRTWSSDKQSHAPISDWENRAVYLTAENLCWLDSIGVSSHLVQSRLCSVQGMHVTDGLTNAALDFDAVQSSGGSSTILGTMVEISNLQQAMLKRIEQLSSAKHTSDIRIIEGSKVCSIEPAGESAEQTAASTYQDVRPILHFDGGRIPLKARLLVGADGANSPVRKYAGIESHGWEYGRLGVVATMQTAPAGFAEPDHNIAHQRFLPTGTIAFLPLSPTSASLVWTLPPDVGKAVVTLQKNHESSDAGAPSPLCHLITAAFRLPWAALQPILNQLATCDTSRGMAWLNPAIEESLANNSMQLADESTVPAPVSNLLTKSVAAFPLKLAHAESYLGSSMRQTTIAEAGAGAFLPSTLLSSMVRGLSALTSSPQDAPGKAEARTHRGRTALIGDAAHTIHPLAGQGLNLGLADSRSLSAALIGATEMGADLGSHLSLQVYPRERYLANQMMLSAVDHLHWLFVSPAAPGQPAQTLAQALASRAAIWSRSTGFEVLNELGPVKDAIIRFAGSADARRGHSSTSR